MYCYDVIQDEAITGANQSVLSGIGGKKQMNMKALLLLRHWDLGDNCLCISGQMKHFALDFIAFVSHYSSLTSHNETTASGRENEQTLQSYLAKETKGRDHEWREEMTDPAA